jgi:hypothetical protein
MLSDTELAQTTSTYIAGERPRPDNNESPAGEATSPKKTRLLFRLLLVMLISAVAYLCINWSRTKSFYIPHPFNIDKLTVTGILHTTERPSALFRGRVIYEGDTVKDCKVIKIYKDKVLFEKDGKRLIGQVSK